MQNDATTNTTAGYLHDADRSVKDDAASIRRTIKTLTKAGLLPADWTYSVRYRTASMVLAIDITATAPRPVHACNPDRYSEPHAVHGETGETVTAWADRFTIEAKAVRNTLSELLDGHNRTTDHGPMCRPSSKFYQDLTIKGEPVEW